MYCFLYHKGKVRKRKRTVRQNILANQFLMCYIFYMNSKKAKEKIHCILDGITDLGKLKPNSDGEISIDNKENRDGY